MKQIFKLSISDLNRLNNDEFLEVFNLICSTLEEINMSEEYLTTCLEKVLEKQESLGFLKSLRARHPISREVKDLTEARFDYFSMLKARVTYNLKSPFEAESKASEKLDMWLQPYRSRLKRARMFQQNAVVKQMRGDLALDDSLADAMTDAGVAKVFEQILAASAKINTLYVKRSKDKEARNKMARAVRNAAYSELKTMMSAFDMAVKHESDDSDHYVGYKNEIAKTLASFDGIRQGRSTRKKAAEEAKAEAEANANGQQPEASPMGARSIGDDGMGVAMTNVANAAMISRSSKPKPIVPKRSKQHSVISLADVDLQKEDIASGSDNEEMTSQPLAMTESDTNVTNGEPLDGEDYKEVMGTTAGNGGMGDDALENSTQNVEDTDNRHWGADDVSENNSDQEE